MHANDGRRPAEKGRVSKSNTIDLPCAMTKDTIHSPSQRICAASLKHYCAVTFWPVIWRISVVNGEDHDSFCVSANSPASSIEQFGKVALLSQGGVAACRCKSGPKHEYAWGREWRVRAERLLLPRELPLAATTGSSAAPPGCFCSTTVTSVAWVGREAAAKSVGGGG